MLPIFEDDALNDEVLGSPTSLFAEPTVGDDKYLYTLEHFYASYDRRIVRIDRSTDEREVLVASVREAFDELREQPNISLKLEGFSDGRLIMRKIYLDQDEIGRTVMFDPETLSFE